MVASILRLRLLSLASRVVRPRTAAEAWAVVIAVILVAAAAIGILVFDRTIRSLTMELRSDSFILLGSVVVAGFWLLPFVFRLDDPLSPRAFNGFALRPSALAGALLLARLLSVPVLLLVLLLAVHAQAWRGEGAAVLGVAVVADIVIAVLCVLGAQVASAIASRGIPARNLGVLGVIIAVAVGASLAVYLYLLDWWALGITLLRRAASVLEWTPFGVVWAAPGAAAEGDMALAWQRIGLGAALAVVLAVVWYLVVRHAGRSLPRRRHEQRQVGLGMFDVLPPTAGGVVAARSIVYWMRDPRYAVPILILPLLPILIALSFLLAGIPEHVVGWLCIPLVTLLIGWSVHNDISADGTAFWLHVVTGVSGRADRWGRIVPALCIGAVVSVGGSYLTAWLFDMWDVLLPLIALSSCTLLVALGIGSAASAIAPYPTVAPGDGPFAQPQAMRGGEGVKQATSLLLVLVFSAPTIGFMIAGVLLHPSWFDFGVWFGFGFGAVALVLGIEAGALAVNRRAPEILAFTNQNT